MFEQHLNAAQLDAAIALYEADARFLLHSGGMVVGRDQIRDVLAELIGMKAQLQVQVLKVVAVGDLALLYTNWQGTTAEPSGQTNAICDKAV